MKRPSDQVKLLFFALLRSTATALASEKSAMRIAPATEFIMKPPSTASAANANAAAATATTATSSSCTTNPSVGSTTNLRLRIATRFDVPGLQRCNLACLPENYNSQFYASHLKQWPDLALVAEEIIVNDNNNESNNNESDFGYDATDNTILNTIGNKKFRRPFFSKFANSNIINNNNNNNNKSNQPESKIVAYVLGKIENRAITIFEDETDNDDDDSYGGSSLNFNDPLTSIYDIAPSSSSSNPKSRRQITTYETIGHVTSLAVLKEYRRQGLAQALMKQLHYHLQVNHYVGACGLHVRKSNLAARDLYCNDGYEVADIIPSYYQDGEDAYFMRKSLVHVPTSETALKLILPRMHTNSKQVPSGNTSKNGEIESATAAAAAAAAAAASSQNNGNEPELLRGTM